MLKSCRQEVYLLISKNLDTDKMRDRLVASASGCADEGLIVGQKMRRSTLLTDISWIYFAAIDKQLFATFQLTIVLSRNAAFHR